MIVLAILRGLVNRDPYERGLARVACFAVPATKVAEVLGKIATWRSR